MGSVGADASVSLGGLVNASRATGDQAGASLAVNPTNPANLVVRGLMSQVLATHGGPTDRAALDRALA